MINTGEGNSMVVMDSSSMDSSNTEEPMVNSSMRQVDSKIILQNGQRTMQPRPRPEVVLQQGKLQRPQRQHQLHLRKQLLHQQAAMVSKEPMPTTNNSFVMPTITEKLRLANITKHGVLRLGRQIHTERILQVLPQHLQQIATQQHNRHRLLLLRPLHSLPLHRLQQLHQTLHHKPERLLNVAEYRIYQHG
jgi:hypothetical protein